MSKFFTPHETTANTVISRHKVELVIALNVRVRVKVRVRVWTRLEFANNDPGNATANEVIILISCK